MNKRWTQSAIGGGLFTALIAVTAAASPADAEEPSAKRWRFGPHYKASSRAPKAQDISKNAYGAYSYAPKAPKIGDRLANIKLPAVGDDFDLEAARKNGPVVIVFYRGFW